MLTDFGALSEGRKKVWAVSVWKHGRDESWWFRNGMVGNDAMNTNRPVQRITELTRTGRGDICIMQLVADLMGDGVVGDNVLDNNEEAMVNDTLELKIDMLRMGVKSQGEMSEQANVLQFRTTARDKLAFRLSEVIDEMMFLCASGVSFAYKTDGSTRSGSQLPQIKFAADIAAPTSNRKSFAAAGATAVTQLTATDVMTWDQVVDLRTIAKRKKIRPIRMGGKSYYILILSPEQCRDLKKDNDYKALVSQGGVRGPKNPLFTGAVATIDDVVIHDHNKVFNTLGAASGAKWGAGLDIDGAQALLLGAQAVGLAMLDNKVLWRESDQTDYGNRPGIAAGRMFGMVKSKWLSPVDGNTVQDFSVISHYTAAA